MQIQVIEVLQLWVTLTVGKWMRLLLLEPEAPEIARLTSHDYWKLRYEHLHCQHEHRKLSHRLIITATYTNNGTRRCVLHVRACRGGGVLVGFCQSSFPNRKLDCIVSAKFEAQKLFPLVGGKSYLYPLLSECTAGLFVNLLLTKVDLWEWCCTRRGFSLSSTRFSTFLFPCRSPGRHVLNLLKDARGGEALYVLKPEGYLNDLWNHVCMWLLAARDCDCRFWVVWVLKELCHIDISHIGSLYVGNQQEWLNS